jgi:hypothetical protein
MIYYTQKYILYGIMHNMFLWYNTCNLDIENQSIIPYYVLENKPKTNEINQRKMSTWYYKCKLVRSVRFCLNANYISCLNELFDN